jgi:hypothetical protein
MENLTPKQEKHKQKIELLSRLIDEKAITLTDALLLLSDTEEKVTQPIPSGPIPRTPDTGQTGTNGPQGPDHTGTQDWWKKNYPSYPVYPTGIKYGSGTTFVGFSNTTGQLVNMDTVLTTTGSSSIGAELAKEYLNDLDSQE